MKKTGPILQVEDDENDVMFLELAMETAGCKIPIQVATDGRQALDYLSGSGDFADPQPHPEPSLVLLDLRLPKVPGLDVLKWIRRQPKLKTVPVIVLTSSEATRDIEDAYQLGADSYIVKPVNPGDLVEIVKYICDTWFNGSRKKPAIPERLNRFIKRPPHKPSVQLT